MLYSKKLEDFLKKPLIEIIVFLLITISIIIAISSIIIQNSMLESLNFIFCVIFWVELSIRFFSVKSKKEYFLNYIIDWIAVIPWEMLFTNVQGLNLTYMRLLRLPRVIRVMRFFTFIRSSLGEKFSYFLKKQLEKSFAKQILMLLVFILILVISFGSLFTLMNIQFEQGNPFWFSILTIFGPDSLYTIQNESYTIKIISLILTTTGIIIFNGILIAIVVSKIQQILDSIKEGRGKVFENNHFIILGWNNLVQYIFNELEIYCQTEKEKVKVVVLTENQLEDIRELSKRYRLLDVILRSGEPYKSSTLMELAIEKARIILIFCDNSIEGGDLNYIHDSFIIKSYVTIHSIFKGKKMPSIIANFMDYNNSKYIKYFKDKETMFFNDNYFSAKFLSLLCLNPTFYHIFQELLSYEGNEFHFYTNKKLVGKKFGEVILVYNNSIPIGVIRDKKAIMIPDSDFIIGENDKIITLAENYKSIDINYPYKIESNSMINVKEILDINNLKKVAIIGVNNRLPFVIEEFSKIDTNIDIFSIMEEDEFNEWFNINCEGIISEEDRKLIKYNQCIFNLEEDIIDKIKLKDYDKIIILADEEGFKESDSTKIDSDTLFKLLKIININKNVFPDVNVKLISEIVDPESEDVINKIPSSSFNYVIGTLVISKILNMALINNEIIEVFNQLIQKGGVDIVTGEIISENIDMDFKSFTISFYNKEKKIPLGILRENNVILNPRFNEKIKKGDKIIYLEKSKYEISV